MLYLGPTIFFVNKLLAKNSAFVYTISSVTLC